MHAYSRHSIKIRWKSTDNELEKAYIIFKRWVLLSLKTNVNVHVIELIWALPFLKTCQPIIFEKRKYISQYKYSKETVFLWSCLTLTQLSNKYILILSSDEIIGGKKTIVFLPLGVLFFIVNKKKLEYCYLHKEIACYGTHNLGKPLSENVLVPISGILI